MSTESAIAGKPVVVYGASGYTGRLICEYLREFTSRSWPPAATRPASPERSARCRLDTVEQRSSRSRTTWPR